MPSSPEFVMPPDAPERPSPAAVTEPPAPGPVRHTDEPELPIARPRLPWRQVTAAALVGILIGAGVPSVFQGIDQAAADARVESLRGTAMAYLEAIAAGDSDRATAMVPVESETAPDAVLHSARRLELPEVRMTTIDGDLAMVEVGYRVGGREIGRALEAEHVDGEWRLQTSLAEPYFVHSYEGMRAVSVAGVELPHSRRVLLYPGTYAVDRTTTPLLATGGEPFDVDGDPATPTEIFTRLELAPGIEDAAQDVGIAHIRACGPGDECAIEESADVSTVDGPWVLSIDATTGAVDMVLQLHSRAFSGQMNELRMRAIVDEAGALVRWECSELSEITTGMETCRS